MMMGLLRVLLERHSRKPYMKLVPTHNYAGNGAYLTICRGKSTQLRVKTAKTGPKVDT